MSSILLYFIVFEKFKQCVVTYKKDIQQKYMQLLIYMCGDKYEATKLLLSTWGPSRMGMAFTNHSVPREQCHCSSDQINSRVGNGMTVNNVRKGSSGAPTPF